MWTAAAAVLERVERHADAAALLRATLSTARQEARARYADPFRRRLEHLGARVFGADVSFDVDDALAVTSRTAGGVTVARDQLSGGAREQVGLLSRLACATLVDDTETVPVVVDDALGYSDPDRLSSMADALTEAGRSTQVIVLTCNPDRYRGVTDAEVIAI